MNRPHRIPVLLGMLGSLLFVLLPSCSGDSCPSGPRSPGASLLAREDPGPPPGPVTIPLPGGDATFWPFTGRDFTGQGVDPVNVVLLGHADPVAVRDVLLALDGDRTAFGFPPVPPFDGPWVEAIGDVQTAWGEAGWTGSVIQLQLGDYAPLRVHLRLFRVAPGLTLGAAHFEALIPGTTEHQVLSWEIAQAVVAADLARSGFLAALPGSTPPITPAPSWRDIPAVIYNGLPPELVELIGGPPQPVSGPVSLVNDGVADVFTLAPGAPVAHAPLEQTREIPFDQVVPKPLCSDGPYDYVHVSGLVTLHRRGEVDAGGAYLYDGGYTGQLLVTPMDVTVYPPVPVGEPFPATVSGSQTGFSYGEQNRAQARDRRLARAGGPPEILDSLLRVASQGRSTYSVRSRCPEPMP